MELFGAKFSIALGAWRLRFVLMLEEPEAERGLQKKSAWVGGREILEIASRN